MGSLLRAFLVGTATPKTATLGRDKFCCHQLFARTFCSLQSTATTTGTSSGKQSHRPSALGTSSIPYGINPSSCCWTVPSRAAASIGRFRPIVERHVPVRHVVPRRAKYQNRCYLWGGTHSGALGRDIFIRPLASGVQPRPHRASPYKLRFSERHRVFQVACGNGFTILVAKPRDTRCSYRLFGMGINKDSQLGLQQVRQGAPMELLSEPVPILLPLGGRLVSTDPGASESNNEGAGVAAVQHESNQDAEDNQEANASEEAGKKVRAQQPILSVAAGRAHTVVVTQHAVYTLGNNSFGQCGRRIIEKEEYFGRHLLTRVQSEGLENVVKAVCGLDHTLLLTANGELFACGWGADGQTGLGHYKSVDRFTKVGGDLQGERIVKLSSRADCVLALNDKGDLFGWGNNEYGQLLGATAESQLHTPKHIKLDRKLKSVAAGGSSCVVVDEDGHVFSWGYGVLGVGPTVERARTPRQIPPPLFGANELTPDARIEHVEAGLSNFAARTSHGHLYTWGRNNNGCLGLGHITPQMFPLRVNISAEVLDISMGIDHMAVITKTFC